MKKNVLIKSILVLVVIALLTIGFTGCAPTYPTYPTYPTTPTTGTVYIVVYGGWSYNLYMDYIQKYWTVPSGTYVLYNVAIGNHFFEAIDTWGWSWGYDSITQYITAGVNYVYLWP